MAAGELLADGLDHLPLPRNDLQRVGDVLAHLHDPVRAAAGADRWGSITTRSRGRWAAGMRVSEIRRLKQLEDENGKLKRLVADLTLYKTMLQDALRKKW